MPCGGNVAPALEMLYKLQTHVCPGNKSSAIFGVETLTYTQPRAGIIQEPEKSFPVRFLDKVMEAFLNILSVVQAGQNCFFTFFYLYFIYLWREIFEIYYF